MAQRIGILTTGGDSPGINAAIRAIGKALNYETDIKLVGFHDGFTGDAYLNALHDSDVK